MAVYTEIPDEELDAFMAGYDLGAVLSLKGIAEGVENSNYLLSTQKGQFILTLYEKRVDPADLPFFIGLMEHLASRGLSCPLPVRDRSGKALNRLAGRPAAIVTFLPGMWVRRPKAEHCAAVGEALARLHLAGEGFALTRRNALSVQGWRPLFEQCGGRADTVLPGLGAEIAAELDYLEANWPRDLPQGSSMPTSSRTTSSSSAASFPGSSTFISPATTCSPTTWRSASTRGASRRTDR